MDFSADRLIGACGDLSYDSGMRFVADLEPVGGPGSPVKPAVYEGGRYQTDRRWLPADPYSGDGMRSVDVIVIDNVPSQANRLEAALHAVRSDARLPELILDLSGAGTMPAHLPRQISSFQFPHRNADAYLRDARLDGIDFPRTDIGRRLVEATPWNAGALTAWFPQALLYGFWQSHLGKKRAQTKHARCWNSEIIGWSPATTETRVLGVKGDPLNLNINDVVQSNEDDRTEWEFADSSKTQKGASKLSEMGHGQVPFTRDQDTAPAGVSFARVTQTATISFAQLRRVSVGQGPSADAAARALIAAIGIAAHVVAFGRSFALRSGADLLPQNGRVDWLGDRDQAVDIPTPSGALALVAECFDAAAAAGVPLDGWGRAPLMLTPKDNLMKAIQSTWPAEEP